jgi:uncharacterized membrane protein
MRLRLLQIIEQIRASFWFMPAMLTVLAGVLALALVRLDYELGARSIQAFGLLYTGGAEGASAVLSTVAGSMATITGVVFSLVMIPLTLASQQFGPRLMRNFLRDRANQFALGVFIATFLYCLLVSRTIRRPDVTGAGEFVPHVAVTAALVLAVLALGVLIYFIHHIAVSIQVDEVVAQVGAELSSAIDRAFPERASEDARGPGVWRGELPADFGRTARPVCTSRDGYVQFVDVDALVRLAAECGLVLRLNRRPGDFVTPGAALADAWPAERVTEAAARRVGDEFVLGSVRAPSQDVEFAVYQLAEIALRALSPGINDPFTACVCIDRLSAALCRLAGRPAPTSDHYDDRGELRVVVSPVQFSDVFEAAFRQIRQAARGDTAVCIRLLEALSAIARCARTSRQRLLIRRQAAMILRSAEEAIPEPHDRSDLTRRATRLAEELDAADADAPPDETTDPVTEETRP